MFSYFSEEKPGEIVKQVVEEVALAKPEDVPSAPEEALSAPEEALSAPEEALEKAEDVVVADKPTTLDKCTPGFSCTIM